MRYHIRHATTYLYGEPVPLGFHMACLRPRDNHRQTCEWHELTTDPPIRISFEHQDYFGNRRVFFPVEGPHPRLEVVSTSRVRVSGAEELDLLSSTPWETVREGCRVGTLPALIQAAEFTFDSDLVQTRPEFAEFAADDFAPERPLLEAVDALNSRIHREFLFDPKATVIATPLAEIWRLRRGVCQDFAHIMTACLRSLGLPARYVSGYLETRPPEGQPRLTGADASHAWVQVFDPAFAWVDFDPTNNLRPADRHVAVAAGRDFNDVTPLRGVLLGGGDHVPEVAVDVVPIPEV